MSVLKLPVERYVDEINAICGRLQATKGELSCLMVFSALERMVEGDGSDEDGDQTWSAVAAALAYYQRDGDPEEEWLQGYGSFGPMSVLPNDRGGSTMYPAEPAKLPEEARQAWRALAAVENLDPLVRGRLCDLLWELGDGPRPHAYAEMAVSCYIEHSLRENVVPCGRDDPARRAATLAATLNNLELISESLGAVEQLVEGSLDSANNELGIVIRGLQTLIDHTHAKKRHRRDTNPDDRDARVRTLIKRSLQTYRHSEQQQQMLDLALAATEDERSSRRLRDKQIKVAESAAEGAEGLMRMVHLDNARRIAAQHGDRDAERRIRRRIEETDMSNAMSEISTDIKIDWKPIRDWVDTFIQAGQGPNGPAAMLLHYGMRGVPVSSPDESRAAIAELHAEHPLETIISQNHFGPYNSVSITVPGGALRARNDLGKYDSLAIGYFAVVVAQRFMKEMQRHYDPNGKAMETWFASARIPARLAERIGVSYERWIVEDYVSAVSVLALVVEGAVRHLADLRGIPVTKTQQYDSGEQMSELRSLGQLIEALGIDEARGGFDALPSAHVRYLEAALVDRWSMNLRNILAHDAEAVLDQRTYCVLFHVICLLAAHTVVTLQEQANSP